MSDNNCNRQLGSRLSLDGNLGTVKFVGSVKNTTGIWLGVEWDNPSRGKHDGKGYFTCRCPNAGSFIRPHSSIIWGRTLLEALLSKYLEELRGPETITLGSSNGAIQVEAVGLDKVRRKLAKLDQLQLISLDGENISNAGSVEELKARIPNVRELDLSSNLFATWTAAMNCVKPLPHLESLYLNGNRFELFTETLMTGIVHTSLLRLHLNSTLISWQELLWILPSMPRLRHLEMGYNLINYLGQSTLCLTELQELNLNANFLSSWEDTFAGMVSFPNLQRFILNSNRFSEIRKPAGERPPISQCIKHISLSENLVQSWTSIDNLTYWCPNLESLSIRDNPLLEESSTKSNVRQFMIARLKSLKTFNSTAITLAERHDSERFYLNYIMKQHHLESDETRLEEHPRWTELCEKHDRPDQDQKFKQPEKLLNKLINVQVFVIDEPCPSKDKRTEKGLVVNLLPTMKVPALRMKLLKVLELPRTSSITAWLELDGDRGQLFTPLDFKRLTDDIQSLGLDPMSRIFVFVGKV